LIARDPILAGMGKEKKARKRKKGKLTLISCAMESTGTRGGKKKW